VDADGFDDLLVGAMGNGSAGANAGAAFLVYGPITGAVSLADADAVLLGEAAGHYAGDGVATGGDLDGDGFADIAVGAPFEDTYGSRAGATYLLYGGGL